MEGLDDFHAPEGDTVFLGEFNSPEVDMIVILDVVARIGELRGGETDSKGR